MLQAHRRHSALTLTPRILLLGLLASLAACTAATPISDGATAPRDSAADVRARTIDAELAVETFDEAWRIIRDTHFDRELGGVDWIAVRDDLRPKAAEALTNDELRFVLGDMLHRLGLSHFAIIPREMSAEGAAERESRRVATDDTGMDPSPGGDRAASGGDMSVTTERLDDPDGNQDPLAEERRDDTGDQGTVGIAVRVVEGQPTVIRVAPGSSAAEAGVMPGWIIEQIGSQFTRDIVEDLASDEEAGRSAGWGEYVVNAVLASMLDRPVGRRVPLVFLDAIDQRVPLELLTRPLPGETVEIGALRLTGEFSSRLVDRAEIDAALGERGDVPDLARIGVIAFTVWIVQMAEPFHRAVDEFRDSNGLVIDLRGNPGGIGGLVMGIGGHFVDEPQSLGAFVSRDGTLQFRANPRRTSAAGELVAPFSGRAAILVDGMSASTSEIFAGGMQAIGRARVFGSTSAGAALPAAMSRLPNGDTLLHAIADYILPGGQRLEGRGVIPDEPVRLYRGDLINGRDAALEAAIRWILSPAPDESNADARESSARRPANAGAAGA